MAFGLGSGLLGRVTGRSAGGQGQPGRRHTDRTLDALFLVLLVDVLGFGLVVPLLPFYAATFGASALVVGLLFASSAAAQLICVPLLGYLSDRWGRRPVLLLSLVGSVVAFALFAVAGGLPLLFLSRIVDGGTGGNVTTVRTAVADVTGEEDRARGFGVVGAALGLGLIVGPALGGLLSRFSFALTGWVAAGFSLVACALVWRWLPETRPAGAVPRRHPWIEVRRLFRDPAVLRWRWAGVAWWACFGAFQTAFPLYVARRLGYDATGTGILLALVGAVGYLVQTRLIGPATDCLGDRRTLTAGLALASAGVLGLAVAPAVALVVPALLLAGTGLALANPALASLLSRTVEPERQGRLQGVSGTSESAGRGAGPLWGNGLIGVAGEGVAYATVALALAALALTTRLLPEPDEGAPPSA